MSLGQPNPAALSHDAVRPVPTGLPDVAGAVGGGLTGAVAQLLAQAGYQKLLANSGMVGGSIMPGASFADTQRQMERRKQVFGAIQEGGNDDLRRLTEAMTKLTGEAGAGGKLAGLVNAVSGVLAQAGSTAQADALHGTRGSTAVMAGHVTQNMAYLGHDPARGGALATSLARQLYDQKGGGVQAMSGIGAGQAGEMFGEMARRGLMSNRTDQMADRIKQMSGAVGAVRDLFGANGRPDAPMNELFEGLDQLTQGSSHWLDPGHMDMLVRRLHAMSRTLPGGLERIMQLQQTGAAMAGQAGLQRVFGVATGESSAAFGKAFNQAGAARGFGALSGDQATLLDQNLRTRAAASPMANSLGAIMSMSEQGLIKEGTAAAKLVEDIKSGDPSRLAALANMTPGQLNAMLRDSGVNAGTIGTFMGAKSANQAQIMRYGIGDTVRSLQGEGGVARAVRSGLSAGMNAVLKGRGMAGASGVVPRLAEEVRQALNAVSASNPDLIDPTGEPGEVQAKYQKLLEMIRAQVMAKMGPQLADLDPAVVDEMITSGLQSLRGRIGRPGTLGAYGNLSSLVAMHRPDVIAGGNKIRAQASADADADSLTSGLGTGTVLSRAMQAVMEGKGIGSVLGESLGGVDRKKVVNSIQGSLQEINALRDQYVKSQDPAERAKIRAEIEQKVGAVKDIAAQAGIGVEDAGEKKGADGKSAEDKEKKKGADGKSAEDKEEKKKGDDAKKSSDDKTTADARARQLEEIRDSAKNIEKALASNPRKSPEGVQNALLTLADGGSQTTTAHLKIDGVMELRDDGTMKVRGSGSPESVATT